MLLLFLGEKWEKNTHANFTINNTLKPINENKNIISQRENHAKRKQKKDNKNNNEADKHKKNEDINELPFTFLGWKTEEIFLKLFLHF